MSSNQKKDLNLNETSNSQGDYLKKIRCSFVPLLGSIFSKETSFIQLLEKTLNSSRSLLHKSAITAIDILCVILSIFVNLIRKLCVGVSLERLEKFITKMKRLESKHQSYCVIVNQKMMKRRSEEEKQKSTAAATSQLQTKCDRKSPCHYAGIENKSAQSGNLSEYLQQISSLACVPLVFVQFTSLIYIIGLTQMRIGFIFLLVCVLGLSSLVLRISFMKHSQASRCRSRKESQSSKDHKLLRLTKPANALFSHITRQESCLQKTNLL